jgi:hypothetical protein
VVVARIEVRFGGHHMFVVSVKVSVFEQHNVNHLTLLLNTEVTRERQHREEPTGRVW